MQSFCARSGRARFSSLGLRRTGARRLARHAGQPALTLSVQSWALTEEYGAFDAIVGHLGRRSSSQYRLGKGAPIKRAALLAPAYLPEVVDNFARLVDLTEPVKEIFWELLKAEARSPLEDWSSPNLANQVKTTGNHISRSRRRSGLDHPFAPLRQSRC